MGSRADVRQRRREKRKLEKRQRTATLLIAAGAVVLAVAAWSVWSARRAQGDSFEYTAADVVTGEPIHAVHEMGVQSPPIPFLPKDGPQPKIAISQRFFDFGSVGPTEVVRHEFALANLGEAPLTISRAYTTCGCTTADFTASVIPPGKVALVTVTFDAGYHDVRGQTVRRGIIIENNDPSRPSAEIWVQASVRARP